MSFHNYMKTVISGIKEWVKENIPELVQSDWNQNDPTADDYIKNRPFYTGEEKETVVIPEVNFTISEGEMVELSYSPIIDFIAGQSYSVNWNGTVYECTAGLGVEGDSYIGNTVIINGQDSGEPFTIIVNKAYNSAVVLPVKAEDGDYVMSVTTVEAEIHKIDEKYIPDTFAHVSDVILNPEYTGYGKIMMSSDSDSSGKTKWNIRTVFGKDGRLLTNLMPSGYPTLNDNNMFCVSNLLFNNLATVNNFDINLTNSACIKAYRNNADDVTLFFTGTSKDTQTTVPGGKLKIVMRNDCDTYPTQIAAYKKLRLSAYDTVIASSILSTDIHLHSINNYPVVTLAQGSINLDGVPTDDVQVRLRNVETPLEDHDATNKAYVDGKISDKEIVLSSSTEGSSKKFKITIDDDGVLTATEIVESAT